MKIIVSTGILWPKCNVKEIVKLFSQYSINNIEIYIPPDAVRENFDESINDSKLIQIMDIVRKERLLCHHFHAPMFYSDDGYSYRRRINVLKRIIHIAKIYKVGKIILHPFHFSTSEEDLSFAVKRGKVLDAFLPGFEKLEKSLLDSKTRFAIENIQHSKNRPLLNTPKSMKAILLGFQSPTSVFIDIEHTTPELLDQFIDSIGHSIKGFQIRQLDEGIFRKLESFQERCPNLESLTIEGQYRESDLEQLLRLIEGLEEIYRVRA